MSSKWIPFLFIFAIIGIVLMIVLRDDKSFVSKIAQMISRNIEGFAPTPVLENPQCPANYKFFTDRRGDSFCCAGSINRYTHRCEVGDAQVSVRSAQICKTRVIATAYYPYAPR